MMSKNQLTRFHALLEYTKAYGKLLFNTMCSDTNNPVNAKLLHEIFQEIQWSEMTFTKEYNKPRRKKFPFGKGV